MSGKQYAVVLFAERDAVEVIPTNWLLGKDVAKWPSKLSTFQISKYIRDNLPADEKWENFKVNVLCSSQSFENAQLKAQEAEETSDLESSAIQHDAAYKKRKRQIPARFQNESCTDDDLENYLNFETSPGRKRFKTPIVQTVVSAAGKSSKSYFETMLAERDDDDSLNEVPSTPIIFDQATRTSSKVNEIFPDACVAVRMPEITDVVEANGTSLFGMIKRMFNEMEQMRLQMKKMAYAQAQMNAKLMQIAGGKTGPNLIVSNLLPNLNLPIQTDDDLLSLNQKLSEDANFSSTMVKHLSNICYGRTVSLFTTNLLRKFMAKKVASLYSRIGRKGKKSLEDLRGIFSVLLTTMSIRFPETRREELLERLGKVLSCSNDWGSPSKKKSFYGVELHE